MRNLYPLIFVSFFFIASIALAQSNTPEFGKEHDALIVSILERLESKDQITQIEASQSLLKVANNGDLPILVKTLRKGNDQPKQIAIVKALAKINLQR